MEKQATRLDGLEEYAAFLDTLPDGVLLVDVAGRIILANTAAGALFGYDPAQLIGQPIDVLVPEAVRDKHARHVEKFRADPVRRAMGSGLSLHARKASGEDLPVDIMLGPVRLAGESCTLCTVRDITDRIRLETELEAALGREKRLARTDSVTGVANSRLFRERAQREISRSRRYGHPFALAYIDLDNFKAINDTLGHATGDQVLRSVAETMQQVCRKTDTIARLGGDEFAILLPETGSAAARVSADKIRGALLEEMRRNDWAVTFSIGVLTCSDPPETEADLIHAADEIMYAVKSSGKDAVRLAAWPRESTGPDR